MNDDNGDDGDDGGGGDDGDGDESEKKRLHLKGGVPCEQTMPLGRRALRINS